jgi:DNA repair protein RecN (Recombination protein N)
MLLSLRIENFALIDRLELEFSTGLNVLTGETGAGKSIILDAIDAALGGKVTSRAIRTGAERGLVEATFRLDPSLAAWLTEQEIDLLDDASLVCSREMVAGQTTLRSRSRLNGVLVNKQQMEILRDRLVEITAQGQTMQLGQAANQREWLDGFGGPPLLEQRAAVSSAFIAYQQALQALEKRRHSESQRLQQLDLYQYQLRELSTANLTEADELEQLEQERQRLSHSVELQQQSYQAYQALYQNDAGEPACADLLGNAEVILNDMLRYDHELQPILDLITDALAQIQEAGRQINAYGESVETDPQRLQDVEDRIAELKQICRKYGPTLADAIAFQQRVQAELEALTGGGLSLEELEQTYQERRTALVTVCARLSELRQVAARELEDRLIRELKPLAMEKVQFQVQIAPIAPTANGADQITFLFSPNPGEPLQPLNETASGGEMSRFLLALKACFSQVDLIGTLVFDEIDVGVSGRVTQAIAEKLYQLSQQHQVLCVTHQPIVAAMADYHFHVDKQAIAEPVAVGTKNGKRSQSKGKPAPNTVAETAADGETPAVDLITSEADLEAIRTVVRVTTLDPNQRREELAQLAGGRSAQEAIAFADSLLAQAADLRQTPATTTIASAEPATPTPVPAKSKARSTSTRARASRSPGPKKA